MLIKELLNHWTTHSYGGETTTRICVNLPHNQLGKIMALVDLYPGQTKEQIITDLLNTVLYELEEALPYVKGEKIIAEDEFGDPVYEDIGLTPRFLERSEHHRQQIQAKTKAAKPS